MKIKVYALSIIHTSNEDEACLDTYVFNSLNKAKEKFRQEEAKWLAELLKYRKRDMADEEFKEWLEKIYINDINHEHEERMYKNYVYDGGDEKVFAIEMHIMEVA